MKKTIIATLLGIGSSVLAQAQINIGTIKGSVGGIPVSYTPSSSVGQVNGGPLLQLLAMAQTIVSRLVPFMIGLAVLAFFWFLIKFIWKGSDDAKAHDDGMKGMGYSILALFVMVSIWGIISALGSMLGVSQGGGLPPLQMPGVK